MQFEQIKFEQDGGTAIITLNRPERRNALSAQLQRELLAALMEADELTAVHCVVLRGAGQHFCAGADLSEYGVGRGPGYRGREEIDDDAWRLEQGQKVRLALFDMHKPVIAQVHGACLGVGTALMALCDMALVAEDARIGFPPVRDFGVPPENLWLYHCGPQWAKRLLLTGDSLSGTDAAAIGLALKALPLAQLEAEVMHIAGRMGLIDPHLLSANKRAVNLGLELMGARTGQRICAELDARGHKAPRARAMTAELREKGPKASFRERDAAFGKGYAAVHGPDPR